MLMPMPMLMMMALRRRRLLQWARHGYGVAGAATGSGGDSAADYGPAADADARARADANADGSYSWRGRWNRELAKFLINLIYWHTHSSRTHGTHTGTNTTKLRWHSFPKRTTFSNNNNRGNKCANSTDFGVAVFSSLDRFCTCTNNQNTFVYAITVHNQMAFF